MGREASAAFDEPREVNSAGFTCQSSLPADVPALIVHTRHCRAAAPGALTSSPSARLDGSRVAGPDARAAPPLQHQLQMTPTQAPPDSKAEELHGALLQLLLNTSGDDYEPHHAMVDALKVLSQACRPIKDELGEGPLVNSREAEGSDSETVELRRLLAEARERAAAIEALMAQVQRRAEEAERERDEFEENAARTLEEELAESARTAAATLEETHRSHRAQMEGLQSAHHMQLEELRQQSQQEKAAHEAASAERERHAEHAERERKLAEFQAKKLGEQKAMELQSAQKHTSSLVTEADEVAQLAEQRAAHAETRQKQVEARLAAALEDKLDAEERWRASISEADELRAQVRALNFAKDQVELGALGSTAAGGSARGIRRGQAMRFERQLAEAEQRASIEKQRGNFIRTYLLHA